MAGQGQDFSISISPALMHLIITALGGPQGGMGVGMPQMNPGMQPQQPQQGQDPMAAMMGAMGGKGGGMNSILPMLAMSQLQRKGGGY